MEIKISTKQLLYVLLFIAWIIFVGICIEAGGFIVNTVLPFTTKTNNASNYWNGLDLSNLFMRDSGNFAVLTSLMIIVSVLKAILFYLIIKLLQNKKLDLDQPFNEGLRKFILISSYLAFGIGIFCNWGKNYAAWLESKNILLPKVEDLRFDGADVWIFMGIILFIISFIIKKGIEIQTENELTI
jgi:hypothetical protein